MIMTKEYYDANVDMAIEIEFEDGHRMWKEMKGCEVANYHLAEDEYFSDCDLCCRQSDDKVRKFLNVVDYNTYHNPKYKNMGLWKVLELALDNWDCV